jgi:thioredoxin 1
MTPALAPLLALALVAVVGGSLRIGQARQRRRLLGRHVAPVGSAPTVLFFTSAACATCHVAQRPALERLARRMGQAVALREVDVDRDPETARRFGILSLPTTIVVAPDGRAVAVNSGFVPETTLEQQLTGSLVETR